MQAIKEKLNDMSAMRKAKAQAKQEEKEEKELAKARVEVAHEVRLAREAEAAMDLHVNKAVEKVAEHERKHPNHDTAAPESQDHGPNPDSLAASPGFSTNTAYGSDPQDPYARDAFDTAAGVGSGSTAGTGYTGCSRSGGPPPSNLL